MALKAPTSDDFSTNQHVGSSASCSKDFPMDQDQIQEPEQLQEPKLRHTDLSFRDGNIALSCENTYFLVHQGLLARHSEVLDTLVAETVERARSQGTLLDGCPVLSLDDKVEDLIPFLQAIYDGLSNILHDETDFQVVSALLRMSYKYHVDPMRTQVLRSLVAVWPTTLAQWEVRERHATIQAAEYTPRPSYPHPLLIIKLAEECDAPELKPSAYYDLSRSMPSELVKPGSISLDPASPGDFEILINILKGRECAARFLSTFIVNELEARRPSRFCLNRHDPKVSRRRWCQLAFENITFTILKDPNGVVCNRNSDPLYAIAEAYLMQTRDDQPGQENKTPIRACEACRFEFGAIVHAAREEFWRLLPDWFGIGGLELDWNV